MPRTPDFWDWAHRMTVAAILVAIVALASYAVNKPQIANVTWYRTTGYSVAVHPRHNLPDGAYILFQNDGNAQRPFTVVQVRGHMSPKAIADFDLSPDAFVKLAPLAEGRLKKVRWRVILP